MRQLSARERAELYDGPLADATVLPVPATGVGRQAWAGAVVYHDAQRGKPPWARPRNL